MFNTAFSILTSTKGKTIIPSAIPAVSILLGTLKVTMKNPYTNNPIIIEGMEAIHWTVRFMTVPIILDLQ